MITLKEKILQSLDFGKYIKITTKVKNHKKRSRYRKFPKNMDKKDFEINEYIKSILNFETQSFLKNNLEYKNWEIKVKYKTCGYGTDFRDSF
ncbi:MAG: hypothetical protein WC812_01535 [Candidatus Pacearchaeota archaeon]|jgi:hypothetical protein